MTSCATSLERPVWSCRTALLPYQEEAVAKLLPTRVGALFMDMGTGKSRTAIELARLRQHKIDRVVWFCPVSLKETVRYEILKHTDCPESLVYMFTDRTNERTVPRDAFWYIVGIESMSDSDRVVLTVNGLITDRSFVIVDESTYIKGHQALRTQRITHIASRCRYRLVLTGTPFTQGVQDLFAQMYFLSPKILGYRSFYSFAANHLEYSDKYPGMIRHVHNTEYLAAKIQPYVYQIRKDECLDLPEKLSERYYCSLTYEQEEARQRVKERLLFDVHFDDWDSLYIFRLFTALQSILCGFVTLDGETLEFPHRRVDLLRSVIGKIPPDEPVVIWAKYRYAVRQIREALAREYGEDAVWEFHGGLGEKNRTRQLEGWRHNGRFLIATQSSGSHGLTLTEARYAVFYANGFKYSERLQAEDRLHRIGQERKPVYIDLYSGTGIEDRIFDAIARKGDALKEFRREVDRTKNKGKKKMAQKLVKLVEAL